MFEKAISKKTAENLALLGKREILEKAYLAGGTALALQIGHRISYDLDFFSGEKFQPQVFLKELSQIKSYHHKETREGTILGRLGEIKFSLFYYPYPLLEKPIEFKDSGIKLASIDDIAAMKLTAISERGAKRDFIDLYFILQEKSLKEVLKLYARKYGALSSNLIHIKKSLAYFAEAEKELRPEMKIPVSWEKIKNFFRKEVKLL